MEVTLDVAAESTIVSIVAEERGSLSQGLGFWVESDGAGETGQGEWDLSQDPPVAFLSSTVMTVPTASLPLLPRGYYLTLGILLVINTAILIMKYTHFVF